MTLVYPVSFSSFTPKWRSINIFKYMKGYHSKKNWLILCNSSSRKITLFLNYLLNSPLKLKSFVKMQHILWCLFGPRWYKPRQIKITSLNLHQLAICIQVLIIIMFFHMLKQGDTFGLACSFLKIQKFLPLPYLRFYFFFHCCCCHSPNYPFKNLTCCLLNWLLVTALTGSKLVIITCHTQTICRPPNSIFCSHYTIL